MKNIIALENDVAVPLENDCWVCVGDDQALSLGAAAILSWPRWQVELTNNQGDTPSPYGILLDPDEDPDLLAPLINRIPLIALQFPNLNDGRAYSQANLLRTRYGFQGDLRAMGEVLRDQLMLMRQCGFTSFAVPEDKSITDALKGLSVYEVTYSRSVINPLPLFRRRQP